MENQKEVSAFPTVRDVSERFGRMTTVNIITG